MPSLRDIRRRIKSVQNTQKITRAMELVAAAKMRKAVERLEAGRPYSDAMYALASDLMRRPLEYRHPWVLENDAPGRVIILVTTDRGLVGRLNANNVRRMVRTIASSDLETRVVTVGRKGRDAVRRLGLNLVAEVSHLGYSPALVDIAPAVHVALEEFGKGDVRQLDLVFSRFVNVGRQEAVVSQLLPFQAGEDVARLPSDFTYEPDPRVVMDALLPRYVEAQVYRGVLENIASAQAAQMVSMRNASDNAGDLIEDLTLTANTVRQDSITAELMDIVGGVAAQQ